MEVAVPEGGAADADAGVAAGSGGPSVAAGSGGPSVAAGSGGPSVDAALLRVAVHLTVEVAVPAGGDAGAGAAAGSGGPSVDVALLCVAVLFTVEACYARIAGAPAGTPDYRLLLAAAGGAMALVGLLVSLRHRSTRHLVRRTPHPVRHGLIVVWAGLGFAALYLSAWVAPIPVEREVVLLIALVESVILLWLLGWLVERWLA
jgi:hypothetical protein